MVVWTERCSLTRFLRWVPLEMALRGAKGRSTYGQAYQKVLACVHLHCGLNAEKLQMRRLKRMSPDKDWIIDTGPEAAASDSLLTL